MAVATRSARVCEGSAVVDRVEQRPDVAVLDRPAKQVAPFEHLLRVEDRRGSARPARADRPRQPYFVTGERTPRGHVQDVARAEPPDREDRRIVRRFDREAAVRRQRRDRFGFERRAAEELSQRRLQQTVVQRAGGEDRGEGHGFSIIIRPHGAAHAARCLRGPVPARRSVRRVRRRLPCQNVLLSRCRGDGVRVRGPPAAGVGRRRREDRDVERKPRGVDRGPVGMPAPARRCRTGRLPVAGRAGPADRRHRRRQGDRHRRDRAGDRDVTAGVADP